MNRAGDRKLLQPEKEGAILRDAASERVGPRAKAPHRVVAKTHAVLSNELVTRIPRAHDKRNRDVQTNSNTRMPLQATLSNATASHRSEGVGKIELLDVISFPDLPRGQPKER